MENYYYPNKANNSKGAGLKVTLPPEQGQQSGLSGQSGLSAAAKRNSLNSLPTSVAEDSQRFYWDSYDLNNDPEGANVTAAAEAVAAATAAQQQHLTPTLKLTGNNQDSTRLVNYLTHNPP